MKRPRLPDGIYYTIEVCSPGSNVWHSWRFCRAARPARWRSESKANAFCARLASSNPRHTFKVVGWLEVFSIPSR